MAKPKNEPKPKLEKALLVKKFGDSLYVPLTKFFNKLGIRQNSIVRVTCEDDKIIIKKEKE